MPSIEGLRVGAVEYFGATRVSVSAMPEKIALRQVAPEDVAMHEATHAVVAIANGTSVRKATIVPGPGYGGLTELSRPDPIAAVAPHALGHSGTGHDIFITRLMGHSEDSLAPIARQIASAKRKIILAVAEELTIKRTLSGSEIDSIMYQVDHDDRKPKNKGAIIFVKKPDGSELKVKTKIVENNVKIPREMLIFSAIDLH